jgi:hypothetical protein
MRRNFLVVAVVLMFGAAASLAAQAKPDFSGKWVMDAAAAPAPPAGAPAGGGGGGGGRGGGGRGGGFGNEFMAAQKGNTLTITRMQGDATVTTVYNLDGTESKNMVAGRGGGEPTAQVSKAVWDGAKLVVTTTINAGGTNIEQKRVFAMEGGNLTIETTQPGRDGGPGTPTKLTYKKG